MLPGGDAAQRVGPTSTRCRSRPAARTLASAPLPSAPSLEPPLSLVLIYDPPEEERKHFPSPHRYCQRPLPGAQWRTGGKEREAERSAR